MIEKKFNFNSSSLEAILLYQSREEIEYLRRLYGKATDLIGISNNKKLRKEGINIYKKIIFLIIKISKLFIINFYVYKFN